MEDGDGKRKRHSNHDRVRRSEDVFEVTEEWPTPEMAFRLLIAVLLIVAVFLAGMSLWPLTGGL